MVSKLSLVAEKLLERELKGSFELKRSFDWCTYKREGAIWEGGGDLH